MSASRRPPSLKRWNAGLACTGVQHQVIEAREDDGGWDDNRQDHDEARPARPSVTSPVTAIARTHYGLFGSDIVSRSIRSNFFKDRVAI